MTTNRVAVSLLMALLFVSCTTLLPVSTVRNGDIREFKYMYITPTKSLTSGSGTTINGQYYATSKTVNPKDVISGILSKEGFILIPELSAETANETIIVNYGESGRRSTGLGGYTIEVTIQFVSQATNSLISSCTAEGQGETEADDIRKAIIRCLNTVTPTMNN